MASYHQTYLLKEKLIEDILDIAMINYSKLSFKKDDSCN